MNSHPSTDPANSARILSETERMGFLPRLFGPSLMMVGENLVYTFMSKMSAEYRGGFWDFMEAGDALYMAPQSPDRVSMSWDMNGYDGVVSKDAAGVIVTLFALSHMCGVYGNRDNLAAAYDRLFKVAARNPEAHEIFRAID